MSAVRGNAAPDLERVRFVTENYEQLKGLKMLPFGPMYLAFAAFYWSQSLWTTLLGVLFFLGGASLRPVIDRYYERKFGHVDPRPPMSQRTLTMALAAIFVVFVVLIMLNNTGYVDVSGYLDAFGRFMFTQQLPVNVPLLASVAIYLVLFGLYRRELRFRVHYVVLSVLAVGASFLPLLGVLAGPNGHITILFVFTGVFVTVGGIFDHLLLVRTMRPLPEEDDGGAV